MCRVLIACVDNYSSRRRDLKVSLNSWCTTFVAVPETCRSFILKVARPSVEKTKSFNILEREFFVRSLRN